MALSYYSLITTLGAAKLATALATSTQVQFTQVAVGDGNGLNVAPSANATSLKRETARVAVNSITVSGNQVTVECVIPANLGGWTVRELGIFDNAGVLIAYGNFPPTYKSLPAEGTAREMVIRVVLIVSNSAAVSVYVDPTIAVASRAWVQSNFSISVLLPGGITGQVLRKKSNASGDVEWFDPTAGLNVKVNVIQERQLLVAAQTVVNLTICTTTGVCLYVDGLRVDPTRFVINSTTRLTFTSAFPAGSTLVAVQNEPANAANFLTRENRFSEIKLDGSAAQATARQNLGMRTFEFYQDVWWAMIDMLYPVGEILITRRSGNPSTWLGKGTWVAYGAGRTLVGVDATDSDFNAVDKAGGSKTHTLTDAEIPAHSHPVNISGTTGNAGLHTHLTADGSFNQTGPFAENGDVTGGNTLNGKPVGEAGDHSHSFAVSGTTGEAGTGGAHNNMPPYVTVFMWLRTA